VRVPPRFKKGGRWGVLTREDGPQIRNGLENTHCAKPMEGARKCPGRSQALVARIFSAPPSPQSGYNACHVTNRQRSPCAGGFLLFTPLRGNLYTGTVFMFPCPINVYRLFMGLLCAAANTAQWLSKNPPLGGFLLPGEKNVKSPKLPIPIRKIYI
jgi:hypothetical protein